jgi:hypothetical protein
MLEAQPGAVVPSAEMGHIHRKHLLWAHSWLACCPCSRGYSRAREYTYDRYGLACCENPRTHYRFGRFAGGRAGEFSAESYAGQTKESSGFWMSFQMVSDYPWLVSAWRR